MSARRRPPWSARREALRFVASLSALPVLAASAGTAPAAAQAPSASPGVRAAAEMPKAMLDLGLAAMDLFDAAEVGNWAAARDALSRTRTAAASLSTAEGAYTDAGGALHRYIQARNALDADLLEAGTALSVQDRRWLVGVASHVAAEAGELSLPFVGSGGTVAPSVEALLFLALRMRRALVWQDDIGFRAATDDFARLWRTVRVPLGERVPADRLNALDAALGQVVDQKSADQVRRLYGAIVALRSH